MAVRPAARRTSGTRIRVAVLGVFLVLSWVGVGYRLFQVQVVQAAEFEEMSLDQRMTRRELAAERGRIFDRNGDPLAMTVEAESIYAVPQELDDPLYVAQQVGGLLGRDPGELLQQLQSGANFVYLGRQVEKDQAARVLELALPGVYSHPESKRVYPAGAVASQVVGIVNIDGEGTEGLEYRYEEVLRGTPGEMIFERDLNGVPIPQGRTIVRPAVPGLDLVTTIDSPLQFVVEDTCARTVETTGAASCWGVVLHAETGEVLAMGGAPGFDPERRRQTDGEGGFENFVVRGTYEPGSTQKLITMATALETGVARVSEVVPQVSDTYEVTAGACRSATDDIYGCFRDFEPHPTIDMTVRDVFTVSSNVGTIRIAERLSHEQLVSSMEAFGQGTATGIDFSGEAAGAVNVDPTCGSCLASASIGYSVAVTPLQMAAAYAAVANDGVWTQPHLVASRLDPDGEIIPFQPERRQVVSEQTARVMRELLAGVVEAGTGRQAQVPGYRVGGKTGTADKVAEDGGYTDITMASFVGMAPIDDPQLVVAVVVDAPAYEYRTGGLAAAPAFAEIMEAALHRLGVTPDGVAG